MKHTRWIPRLAATAALLAATIVGGQPLHATSEAPEAAFAPTAEAGRVSEFTGAAQHRIPLEMPTGAGGLSLPLALTYDSDRVSSRVGEHDSDGGWVGLGWRLDVGRVELTGGSVGDHRLVLDGSAAQLAYRGHDDQTCTDADGWTCDQQRLQHYDTEEARFWRIEKTTRTWRRSICACDVACGGTPTSVDGFIRDDSMFQAWDRSGVRYDFGAASFEQLPWNGWVGAGPSNSSRAYHLKFRDGVGPDHKEAWYRAWGLEKVVDPSGNTIEVQYQSFTSDVWNHNCGGLPDRGWKEVYPRRILYTTNPDAGDLHAEWEVEFLMSEKSFDTQDDYGIAQSGVVLEAVRVWFHPISGASELVREVRFDYEQDLSDDKKSYRLRRVHQYGLGGEAGGLAKPAIELGYELRTVRWNGMERQRYFLTQVDDALGATVSFTYQNFDDVKYRKQIVSERSVDPGLGPVMTHGFDYFEPKSKAADNGTRRLIGFSRVETTRSDRVISRRYHAASEDDEAPLTGKRSDEWTEDLEGNLLERREWDWIATQRTRIGSSTPAGWFVRVVEERDFLWDAHGSEASRKRVFSYDPADQGGQQYGNVVATREYDDVAATVPWRSTWTPRAINTDAWIVDRTRLEAVFAGDLFDEAGYQSLTRFLWTPGDTPDPYTVEEHGHLWAEVRYVTVDGSERTVDTRYAYDGFGNRTATTTFGDYGFDGIFATSSPRTTAIEYGDDGTLPIRRTNALGHVTESYYYGTRPATTEGSGLPGQLQATLDANGIWTARRSYDGFGRPSHLWRPGNVAWDEAEANETWSYDDTERWVRHNRRADDGSTPETLDQWTFFDGLGRVVQTQQRWNSSQKQLTQLHYDAEGRLVRQVLPRVQTWGDNLFHASEWARDDRPAKRFEHDALDRRRAEIDVDGSRRSYEFSGAWGQETRIPASGKHRETRQVDSRGQAVRTSVLDPATFTVTDTHREYDVHDRLRRVWMSPETETVFERDELGRVTSETDPNRGLTTFRYDPAGNLTEQQNAEGERVCHYYDALNRRISRWQTTASCPSSAPAGGTNWVWDEGTHGIGRLGRVDRYWGNQRFGYDARGRRVSETLEFLGDGVVLTTIRTFDEADRVRLITHPDGTVAVADYDPTNGLPLGLTVDGSAVATGALYTQRGELKSVDWGNGLRTRYGFYDETGNYRLESIRTGPPSDIDRDQYLFFDYDADGQLTLRRDFRGPGTGWYEQEDFAYDYLGRLTRARTINPSLASYDLEYRYDGLGRLDQVQDHLAGTVSNRGHSSLHPHALETVDGASVFAYDAAGRATWRHAAGVDWSLHWDFENRLYRATSAAGTVDFDYDAEHRPVRRRAPGRTTYYLGDYELTVDGTSIESTNYLRFGDRRVAMKRQPTTGLPSLRYLHGDRLGSTQLTTDEAGAVLHRVRHLPFGEARWSAGSGETDFDFAGERRIDDLGGLYRMGVRLYDPAYRQWITPDTLIPDALDVEKLDRYAYVTHDPLGLVDPTGHDGELIPLSRATPNEPMYGRLLSFILRTVILAANEVDEETQAFREEALAVYDQAHLEHMAAIGVERDKMGGLHRVTEAWPAAPIDPGLRRVTESWDAIKYDPGLKPLMEFVRSQGGQMNHAEKPGEPRKPGSLAALPPPIMYSLDPVPLGAPILGGPQEAP